MESFAEWISNLGTCYLLLEHQVLYSFLFHIQNTSSDVYFVLKRDFFCVCLQLSVFEIFEIKLTWLTQYYPWIEYESGDIVALKSMRRSQYRQNGRIYSSIVFGVCLLVPHSIIELILTHYDEFRAVIYTLRASASQ